MSFSNPYPAMPFCKAKRHPGGCLRHPPGQGKNTTFSEEDGADGTKAPRVCLFESLLVSAASATNEKTAIKLLKICNLCPSNFLPGNHALLKETLVKFCQNPEAPPKAVTEFLILSLRDQVVKPELQKLGIKPGGNAYARKYQLVNFILEETDREVNLNTSYMKKRQSKRLKKILSTTNVDLNEDQNERRKDKRKAPTENTKEEILKRYSSENLTDIPTKNTPKIQDSYTKTPPLQAAPTTCPSNEEWASTGQILTLEKSILQLRSETDRNTACVDAILENEDTMGTEIGRIKHQIRKAEELHQKNEALSSKTAAMEQDIANLKITMSRQRSGNETGRPRQNVPDTPDPATDEPEEERQTYRRPEAIRHNRNSYNGRLMGNITYSAHSGQAIRNRNTIVSTRQSQHRSTDGESTGRDNNGRNTRSNIGQQKCLLIHDGTFNDFDKARFTKRYEVETVKCPTIGKAMTDTTILGKIESYKPGLIIMHLPIRLQNVFLAAPGASKHRARGVSRQVTTLQ
eukprot:sb/3463889/